MCKGIYLRSTNGWLSRLSMSRRCSMHGIFPYIFGWFLRQMLVYSSTFQSKLLLRLLILPGQCVNLGPCMMCGCIKMMVVWGKPREVTCFLKRFEKPGLLNRGLYKWLNYIWMVISCQPIFWVLVLGSVDLGPHRKEMVFVRFVTPEVIATWPRKMGTREPEDLGDTQWDHMEPWLARWCSKVLRLVAVGVHQKTGMNASNMSMWLLGSID